MKGLIDISKLESNPSYKTFLNNGEELKMMLILSVGEKLNLVSQPRRQGNIDYRIYPCVLLVEGVHHGAGSEPVYYSSAVINASTMAWNNMPVTIGHPVNQVGEYILCNSDGAIRAQWEIGTVRNVRFEGGKLKADLWLNVARANSFNPQLLTFLDNGGQLDVSTGLLALQDNVAGSWNNEEYAAKVLEIIPDHLALLPNQKGACSWDDGCGVRVNKGVEQKPNLVYIYNEQEMGVKLEKIRRYVDGLDIRDIKNDYMTRLNYLRAVYSDYFIYSQDDRPQGQPRTSMLLKQGYGFDTSDNIVLQGEPIEVVEEITYKQKAVQTNKEENTNMPTDEMKCKDATTPAMKKKCGEMMVNALISNENTAFVEADREWLLSLTSQQQEKLVANMGAPEETETMKTNTAIPAVGTVTVTADIPKTPAEILNQFLADAPAPIRSVLNAGMRELDRKRGEMIGQIKANERNKFNDDQFKDMDLSMLESIVSLLPVATGVDYSGLNPASTKIVNKDDGEEPYVPMTLSESLGQKK